MRYVTGLVILIAASMACSRGNDRAVAQSPTSPTAVAETTIAYIGGVSGPMDVVFPGRNESFMFRNDLEAKYASGLGRSAAGTSVDREGEVVWLQEYIRYRVNGCDHATAMSRVNDADRWRRRRRHLCGALRRSRSQLPAAQRHVRGAPHARDQVPADGPLQHVFRRSGGRRDLDSASTCAIAPTGAVTPMRKPRSSRRSTAAHLRPPASCHAAILSVPTSLIPARIRARRNSRYAR